MKRQSEIMEIRQERRYSSRIAFEYGLPEAIVFDIVARKAIRAMYPPKLTGIPQGVLPVAITVGKNELARNCPELGSMQIIASLKNLEMRRVITKIEGEVGDDGLPRSYVIYVYPSSKSIEQRLKSIILDECEIPQDGENPKIDEEKIVVSTYPAFCPNSERSTVREKYDSNLLRSYISKYGLETILNAEKYHIETYVQARRYLYNFGKFVDNIPHFVDNYNNKVVPTTFSSSSDSKEIPTYKSPCDGAMESHGSSECNTTDGGDFLQDLLASCVLDYIEKYGYDNEGAKELKMSRHNFAKAIKCSSKELRLTVNKLCREGKLQINRSKGYPHTYRLLK